jgi:hypothetical protein
VHGLLMAIEIWRKMAGVGDGQLAVEIDADEQVGSDLSLTRCKRYGIRV